MVAQAARVQGRRHEVVAQREHLEERRGHGHVAEVVPVLSLRQGRARGRLHGHQPRLLSLHQILSREGKRDSGEVGSASGAPDDHVGVFPGQLHLLQGFQADHRLVQADVVEHASQRVAGSGVRHGVLDRLGDRDAQGSGGVGVLRAKLASELGLARRTRMNGCSPGFHGHAAVGLLPVAGAHHVDVALDVEQLAGQGQGTSPLAGTGFGGQALDPGLFGVPGLGDRGIRFVRSRWRGAFVLVVDVGRGVQRALQPHRAHQRRRTPQRQNLAYRLGDLDPSLGGHFLLHHTFGEDGFHHLRRDGLLGPRMQVLGHRRGHVGGDVVPRLGNVLLGEIETGRSAHRSSM